MKISVIIPVYNCELDLRKLLGTLIQQDYPSGDYEIIVVDNGSLDNTLEVIKGFQRRYPELIRWYVEDDIRSSYAARNKGIHHAGGEVFAFTDSDCTASSSWLNEGIKELVEQAADLVGGKIEFYFSEDRTAAEIYDSIGNKQIESNIRERGVANTANLFVKATVFDRIGLFPDYLKNGGDFLWTQRATKRGFKLVYSPGAVIWHPARRFKSLFKKQFRSGTGQFNLLFKNKSLFSFLYTVYRSFLPPNLFKLSRFIRMKQPGLSTKKICSIWIVSYLCNLSMNTGIILTLFKALFGFSGRKS